MTTSEAHLSVSTPSPLLTAWVLTGRSIRHGLRQFDSLIISAVVPVLLMLTFVYIFGGAIETGTEYLNYVVPGVILLTAGFGAAQAAISVSADMTDGMIDRFRSLPMASSALMTGHVVARLVSTLASTVIVLAVAVLMGFRPVTEPLAWLGALGIVALYVLAVAWLAAIVGLVTRTTEAAAGFTFFILFFPYLSSAFVPTETLPRALRGFAEHQPVTQAIETIRALLLGTPVGSTGWIAVAWCVGIIAVSVVVASVLFQRRSSG